MSEEDGGGGEREKRGILEHVCMWMYTRGCVRTRMHLYMCVRVCVRVCATRSLLVDGRTVHSRVERSRGCTKLQRRPTTAAERRNASCYVATLTGSS